MTDTEVYAEWPVSEHSDKSGGRMGTSWNFVSRIDVRWLWLSYKSQQWLFREVRTLGHELVKEMMKYPGPPMELLTVVWISFGEYIS